jgi:hypothetical protein
VLIARDRNGKVSDFVDPALQKSTVHEFLAPIIDRDSILCPDGHSWYKTFSRDYGIAHHRLIVFDNQRVYEPIERLDGALSWSGHGISAQLLGMAATV